MNNKSVVSLSADAAQLIDALGLAHLLLPYTSENPHPSKGLGLNAQLLIVDERERGNNIVNVLPNSEVLEVGFDSLEELYSSIRKIAASLGHADEGERLLESCDERVNIIVHKIKFIIERPQVMCLKNTEPLSFASPKMEELITLAGGLPVSIEKDADATKIVSGNPDILLLMADEKSSIQQALQVLAEKIASGEWANIPAVINNKVFVTEKMQKGSLAINDLEMLAEIINDGDFYFGYEGERWVRFETA